MSEFKGTPGPWLYADDDWSDADSGIVTNEERISNGKIQICILEGAGSESGFSEEFSYEQRENLKLIASAPELLEALLRVRSQFDQAGFAPVAGSMNPAEDNYAFVNQVITKVLGGDCEN